MRFACALVAVFGLTLAAWAGPDNIFSNLTSPPTNGTLINASNTKACGFNTPAGRRWFIRNATLNLDLTGGGTPEVSLWTGGGMPTTRVFTFGGTDPTPGTGDFNFGIGSSVFLLEPSTRYWLVVSLAPGSSGSFIWNGATNNPTGICSFFLYIFNGQPSSFLNKLRLDAQPMLIDNLAPPFAAGTGTSFAANNTTRKDAGFRIPQNQDYLFDVAYPSIDYGSGGRLRLDLLQGAPFASTLLQTFNSPTLSGTALFGYSVQRRVFDARGTYWMGISNASTTNSLLWLASSPQVNPSGAAANAGYFFGASPSATFNRYGISARPVISTNFDNYPITSGVSIPPGTWRAASFTLPPGRLATLWTVHVPMSFNGDSFDNVRFSIWSGATSPTSRLRDLEFVGGTGSGGNFEYIFRSPTPFTLTGGTTYWIREDNLSGSISHTWTHRPAAQGDATARGLAYGGRYRSNAGAGTEQLLFAIIGPGVNGCPADVSGSADPADPAYGVPDGIVDAADFFFFLDQFVTGNADEADLSGSADPGAASYGYKDGVVDASDFFYFLDLFVVGCP